MRLRRRPTIEQLAYSFVEAAEAAGVGKSLIQDAVKHGQLPVIEKGGRRLILTADLEAWLVRDRVIRNNGSVTPAPPVPEVAASPPPPAMTGSAAAAAPRRRGRPPGS